MKNKCSLLFILLCFTLYSCVNKAAKESENLAQEDTTAIDIDIEKPLPELEAGELFYKNKEPFGTLVELTGKPIIADTVIFKLAEPTTLIKNNRLIIKNIHAPIMLFQLPEMKFIGYRGSVGNGPTEFMYPSLVPAIDSTLCYIYNKRFISKITNDNELVYNVYKFTDKEKQFDEKQMLQAATNKFLYAEKSSTGKSIFSVDFVNDSAMHKEIKSLSLTPRMKSWVPYIGDFVANPKKNRMVYAYKYFKIIKFMDMEAKTTRIVNFEKEEFEENTLYKLNGMDDNTTHYWGACAGKDYVYFLYSGRKPAEVWKENQKGIHYIFVEQYDWNGTPIKRYKLDQWGFFTVDEENGKLYLLSTNHDDPFFIYDLPAI